ncbi:HEPN domain-containing protein [Candidatus Poribacteria bacterium]|nr:HEPN domain-containing protein [Candidatus Poribacteria bacterium]
MQNNSGVQKSLLLQCIMKQGILESKELIQRLQESIGQLRRFCEPEFIVLFGSYAYGQPHKGSDVDVLLVLSDDMDGMTKQEASATLSRHFGSGLEVHPCTLSQWREALLKRNWFVADITNRGIPLFSNRDWAKVLMEVESLMNQSENLYPQEWLQWAEDDWRTVTMVLDGGMVFVAAYHLQQAVEKWLKAFWLHHGWQLERIHDLDQLLDEAVLHEPGLKRFRAMCSRVKYFIAARYPGLPNPPTEEELREQWLSQAEELRAFVRNEINSGLQPNATKFSVSE